MSLDVPSFAQAIQQSLLADLQAASKIRHPTTQGDEGEAAWRKFLAGYLPKRYAIRSGQILDSNGKTSEQIDVIIYDPHYTPVWFPQPEHAYVLAEAVYAVFEVKPTLDKAHLDYAADKAASVRALHRTSAPVLHSDGPRHPKPPFPIVAGLLTRESTWTGDAGAHLQRLLPEHAGNELLNFGIALDSLAFEFVPGAEEEFTVMRGNTALVQLLYRLLARLQSLGTVPAIDWSAYIERFSQAIG